MSLLGTGAGWSVRSAIRAFPSGIAAYADPVANRARVHELIAAALKNRKREAVMQALGAAGIRRGR